MTESSPHLAIVGSGPAAAGAASALIAAGHRVSVLDVGLTPDPAAVSIKETLAALPTGDWTEEMIQTARGRYRCTPDGLEVKKQFGSDFATRVPGNAVKVEFADAENTPSFAFGGLSNIWGASTLPYRAEDMADWPLAQADLLPHYRAAASLLGGTGEAGDPLDAIFPRVHESLEPLSLSRAGRRLLDRMKENRAALVSEGVHFGMARVAVRTGPCRLCGLCMHGCPDDLIYSSAQSFDAWRSAGVVDYRGGTYVRRFAEREGKVEVTVERGGGMETLEFDRLFVAAGVIPTSAIVLSSLEMYDRPVRGKDSHYFLFPLFSLARSGAVREEALHTLSQVFLDLVDGQRTAHVQIYSYSDIIDAAVSATLGPFAFAAPWILSRMLIGQGFLHSDYSAGILHTLRRGSDGAETLRVEGEENPASARERSAVLAKLFRMGGKTGVVPLIPMTKVGRPGRSIHCGSTFPMVRSPSGLQTDLLGRLAGLSRIHLVDASVLPSIPATTIAFSAMANAHRIATGVLEL